MPEGGIGVKKPIAVGGVGFRGGLEVGLSVRAEALVLAVGFRAPSGGMPPGLGFSVMGEFRDKSLPLSAPGATASLSPAPLWPPLPSAPLLADPPPPPPPLSILPPQVVLVLLPGAREERPVEDLTGRLLLAR